MQQSQLHTKQASMITICKSQHDKKKKLTAQLCNSTLSEIERFLFCGFAENLMLLLVFL